MAKVRLNGDSSGFIELAAPNAAGSNTLTLPTSNGSANQLLKNSGTAGALAWSTLTEDSSGNLNVDSGTLFVDATNNRVGIGTTSPGTALDVSGAISLSNVALPSAGTARIFSRNTDSNLYIQTGSGSTINLLDASQNTMALFEPTNVRFFISNSEKARLDSSGRLLLGTSSTSSTDNNANFPNFQLEGGVGDPSRLLVRCNGGTTSTNGPVFYLARSRGTTANSKTAVAADDLLGTIIFEGTDGTHDRRAAAISAFADAGVSTDDMPGRLVFATSPDGTSNPTERLRISQNGNVLFSNVTNFVKPAADNAVAMGASGGRWSEIWAANGTIQTSDERAKAEITDATLGADFIKALRPVSYKWVEGGQRHTGEYDEDGNFVYESVPGNRRHWGFIAQEVKEATDAAGVDFGGWVLTDKDDPDSQQALRYDQFIAPLTKALQEALAEIDVLKAKVAALESA